MTKSDGKAARAITAGRARLAFLWDENVPQQITAPCRLPGCSQPVKRKDGAGRTKWFHKDVCLKEFRRRRLALDKVIGELVDLHGEGGHGWRGARDLEWEIRRLVSARTAYVGPGDWIRTTSESEGTALQSLIDEWRQHRVEAKKPNSPCPTCDGTGDFNVFLASLPKSVPSTARAPGVNKQAFRGLNELDRLTELVPHIVADDLFSAGYELRVRLDLRTWDPEVPTTTFLAKSDALVNRDGRFPEGDDERVSIHPIDR